MEIQTLLSLTLRQCSGQLRSSLRGKKSFRPCDIFGPAYSEYALARVAWILAKDELGFQNKEKPGVL